VTLAQITEKSNDRELRPFYVDRACIREASEHFSVNICATSAKILEHKVITGGCFGCQTLASNAVK